MHSHRGNEQARRGEQEREMQQRRQRATEDGKGESDSCGANATKCIKLIIVAFKTLVVAGTKRTPNRFVYNAVSK